MSFASLAREPVYRYAFGMLRLRRRSAVNLPPAGRNAGADPEALLTAYQVLFARYASTTQAQWQVPFLGMTAEAALLAGILASHARLISAILAIVSIVVAIACPAATRRIELTAWWDRDMLDDYERKLLPPSWRLHHTMRLHERLGMREFKLGQTPEGLRIQGALVRLAPPSLVLNLAVAAVSSACIVVAAVTIVR